MPSPHSSVLSERIIYAALDMLDQQRQELCAVIESEHASPEEKYESLVSLAYMTGILTCEADKVATP
jgi:hypothetical protein